MKIKKLLKRGLALMLACSLSLSCSLRSAAAPTKSQTKTIMSINSGRKAANTQVAYSPLYYELMATKRQAEEVNSRLVEEGKTWVDEVEETYKETMFGEYLGVGQQFAEIASTTDTTGTAEQLFQIFNGFGSFLGVADAMSSVKDILHLQGDTAWEQLAEVAVLTAQFGIAAFSIIGLSLSFPWSVIVALILETLLQFIQRGFFQDLFEDDDSDDGFESLQHYKLQDGTNVYKPNIYIYASEETEVTVTFAKPELLTQTIPDYSGRWTVTADADGTLTDADGQTYGYLFYESVTSPALFQTAEGWRIPAETRRESFEQILTELNFSEREIADFTEFWVEKLDPGVDYIMYPQNTARVDRAMPIEISKKPASLERIWFAFAVDDGREVGTAGGYALSRGGRDCPYYVVEWGGLILKS